VIRNNNNGLFTNKIPKDFMFSTLFCTEKLINLVFLPQVEHLRFLGILFHLSWLKKWLMVGIISGGRVRRNFLRPCSAYFSPSSLLSNTAMLRLVLLTLYQFSDQKLITKMLHSIHNHIIVIIT